MIADFHNDILSSSGDIDSLSRQTTDCVCALFRGKRSFETLRNTAHRFNAVHAPNLVLGLEDIGYFNNENEEEILSWRPVYASLTWNFENALAGGCLSDGRLTKEGKRAAALLSRHKIYIDCAHINRKSFADLLESKTYGIINSHTCFNTVRKHPRNLADWQAREIADRGGLIGIAFVCKFLRKNSGANIDDVFRHIDYGVERFGIGAICIGSDFYGTDDLPKMLKNYSQTDLLEQRLSRAGYTEMEVDAVMRNNLQQFLKTAKNI